LAGRLSRGLAGRLSRGLAGRPDGAGRLSRILAGRPNRTGRLSKSLSDRYVYTVKGLVRDGNTGQRWREFTVPRAWYSKLPPPG
jgi:hypothetical protein